MCQKHDENLNPADTSDSDEAQTRRDSSEVLCLPVSIYIEIAISGSKVLGGLFSRDSCKYAIKIDVLFIRLLGLSEINY